MIQLHSNRCCKWYSVSARVLYCLRRRLAFEGWVSKIDFQTLAPVLSGGLQVSSMYGVMIASVEMVKVTVKVTDLLKHDISIGEGDEIVKS